MCCCFGVKKLMIRIMSISDVASDIFSVCRCWLLLLSELALALTSAIFAPTSRKMYDSPRTKLPHEFTVCCISLLRMITEEWKKNENRCGVSQSKKYGYEMKNAISSARRSLPSAVEQHTTRTSAQ